MVGQGMGPVKAQGGKGGESMTRKSQALLEDH